MSQTLTLTLRVHRFTPRPQKARSSSPFAKKSSPFSSTSRKPRGKSWVQEYEINVSTDTTLLDCLLKIKREIDPTLAFRYSCGHGMCGSDAVAVNGTPTLLCTATVGDWVKTPFQALHDDEGFRRTDQDKVTEDFIEHHETVQSEHVIELAALPGFPVQRDLIADINQMLEQIKRLKPYLINDGILATTIDGKVDVFEYLQRPEQLQQYEILTTCIACGVCEGLCPVYAGGEAFVGPAALINTARFVNDNRDLQTEERLDMVDSADGIQACQSVRACSRECPKGIDVGEEVWQLITKVKER